MEQGHLTDCSGTCKAPRHLKPNPVNANLTVHAIGAVPSLPLGRLRTATYRIADDADADLRVPGLDTPVTIRTVLVLSNDSLKEVLEVEHLGIYQEINGERIELRAPGSEVYLVIEA